MADSCVNFERWWFRLRLWLFLQWNFELFSPSKQSSVPTRFLLHFHLCCCCSSSKTISQMRKISLNVTYIFVRFQQVSSLSLNLCQSVRSLVNIVSFGYFLFLFNYYLFFTLHHNLTRFFIFLTHHRVRKHHYIP